MSIYYIGRYISKFCVTGKNVPIILVPDLLLDKSTSSKTNLKK